MFEKRNIYKTTLKSLTFRCFSGAIGSMDNDAKVHSYTITNSTPFLSSTTGRNNATTSSHWWLLSKCIFISFVSLTLSSCLRSGRRWWRTNNWKVLQLEQRCLSLSAESAINIRAHEISRAPQIQMKTKLNWRSDMFYMQSQISIVSRLMKTMSERMRAPAMLLKYSRHSNSGWGRMD